MLLKTVHPSRYFQDSVFGDEGLPILGKRGVSQKQSTRGTILAMGGPPRRNHKELGLKFNGGEPTARKCSRSDNASFYRRTYEYEEDMA